MDAPGLYCTFNDRSTVHAMSPDHSRRPSGDIRGFHRGPEQSRGLVRRFVLRAPGASVPSAALVVDHRVLTPFGPAGLGLAHVGRWSEHTTPLPTVSHLALDLFHQFSIALTYLVHPDDYEAPLLHWEFVDAHSAPWLSARATGKHALLVVGDSAAISQTWTPETAGRALSNVWAGIIGCSDTCVVRAAAPHAPCARHSLRQSPGWSVASGL